LFFLCIIGIALLGGRWVLQGYFNGLVEGIIAVSSEYAHANQEIKKINHILRGVQQIQDQYFLWTPVLSEFTTKIPDAVILSRLSFDIKTKTAALSGTAATRDDLLDLQRRLESLSFIASASIPLSQLTKKENISFSLTAQMN